MSREIKFRIWDKKHKEFIVKDDLALTGEGEVCLWEDLEAADDSDEDSQGSGWIDIVYHQKETEPAENYIIQQFTGLTDKNGVEIYEGDIVKYRKKNRKVSIGEFWDGVDDRVGMFIQDPQIQHRNFGTNKLSSFSSCEVIGNIHANPELLK
jgi:uncharacterized phage protein (TIGR01671 family)